MKCQQIVLMGLPGVGKTTVGRGLAYRLGWGFLDLDQWVRERFDVLPPSPSGDVSADDASGDGGWVEFRRYESKGLKEALQASHHVIALGGGTLVAKKNQRLLAAAAKTVCKVWLQMSPRLLAYRCYHGGESQSFLSSRPLLEDLGRLPNDSNGNEEALEALGERLERLWQERKGGYEQADVRVNVQHCSEDVVVSLSYHRIMDFYAGRVGSGQRR